MSKILVTGGKGFIGTNLVNELRTRGHQVHTCDLTHDEDEFHVRADVSSYFQLSNVVRRENFDFVYHLAAEYGRWNGEAHYENLWKTNVIGTKNLLRLQEELGFKQIFFSSCEVYGDYDGLMSEDVMDQIAIKQLNDYALSKWVGEQQVLNSASMFRTQSVRVRPLNCYGPHEHYSAFRGVIPIMVYRALKKIPYTVYGGHLRVFDYVGDTVRTLANIVDNFIPGEVYNIGSDEEWGVDIATLSNMILEKVGIDDSLVTYSEQEKFTTKVKIVDLTKSRKDLGHKATINLSEGLDLYIAWMSKTYF
jgi:dTDP-glucose 4,6-dehydratase